jgi:ATP sulfurylase
MTKRDYFMGLKAKYNLTVEEIAFIDHEIELLDKKNSAEKKPTAQQIENAKIQEAIYRGMQPIRLYSITELIKEIPECNDLTNQRVSALIKQMLDTKIERVEEKRKAYFRRIG